MIPAFIIMVIGAIISVVGIERYPKAQSLRAYKIYRGMKYLGMGITSSAFGFMITQLIATISR